MLFLRYKALHYWSYLKTPAWALFPLSLWIALWLGIFGSHIGDINGNESLIRTLRGYFSIAPIIAALIAIGFISYQFMRGNRQASLVSPLGMATLYGASGILATSLAPDRSNAWYWALMYLSVPAVLWAIVQVENPLDHVTQIMNSAWLFLLLICAALFAVGIIYMDLEKIILNPIGFLRCEPAGHWFTVTSGHLRATGVGRYAAIAAIICLGAISSKRYSWAWALLLTGALMLLFTTHARGAMGGFAVAVCTMSLLYWGRKAAIAGGIGGVVIVTLFFGTNLADTFLYDCFGARPVRSDRPVASPSEIIVDDPVQIRSKPEANLAKQSPAGQIPKQPMSISKAIPNPPIHPSVSTLNTSNNTFSSPGEASNKQASESRISTERSQNQESTIMPHSNSPPTAEGSSSTQSGTTVPSGSGQVSKQSNNTGPPGSGQVSKQSENRDTTGSGQVSKQSENRDTAGQTPGISAHTSTLLEASQATVKKSTEIPPTQIKTSSANNEINPSSEDKNISRTTFTLSGRQEVWDRGITLISHSWLLGYGFHSDRLLLNTHIHNAYLHAAIQAGIIGLTFFVLALLFAWILVWKVARKLNRLPTIHKHLVIQSGGILAFFTARAIPESSGAFFGVDWIILALLMLYLERVNKINPDTEGIQSYATSK